MKLSVARPTRPRWLPLALAAGALAPLLVAGSAAAEPARFEYTAPATCPNEDEFVARVHERSVHERPATDGELALRFVVTVSVDADGASARVDFVDAGDVPVSRAVRGATCDEVVSGIALVTALAIDARAGVEPSGSAEPAPSSTPPVAPAPAATPAPAPPVPSAPPSTAPPERSAPLTFTAGLGGGFQSVAGPSGGGSLDAFFAINGRRAGAGPRLGVWHWRASGTERGLEGTFRGWGGRLDECPLAFGSRQLFLATCAGFELGVLRAEGVASAVLPTPKPASIFWASADLLARFGSVLGERVLLEAEASLVFPLVRRDFGFSQPEPRTILYSVPDFGAGVGAHAGVRFP